MTTGFKTFENAIPTYLGFHSGYHSRQKEIEKIRDEGAESMAKK